MALDVSYTDERPTITRSGRAADPLRAPVDEAVGNLTVDGRTLVIGCPADDAEKIVRFARQSGNARGFTVRSLIEDGSKKGTAKISLWAVKLQQRPGSGRKAKAESVD